MLADLIWPPYRIVAASCLIFAALPWIIGYLCKRAWRVSLRQWFLFVIVAGAIAAFVAADISCLAAIRNHPRRAPIEGVFGFAVSVSACPSCVCLVVSGLACIVYSKKAR